MRRKVRQAQGAVAAMVEAARPNFRSAAELRVAVLSAWCDLAGISEWTPEMVDLVEALCG